MIYSQIGNHIRAGFTAIQSDYREWQDGFNFRNVPETIFDKSYHIDIAPTSTGADQNDRSVFEEVAVDVTFLRKGYNQVQDVMLDCLDDIHCFKLQIIDQTRWQEQGNVRKVVFNGLTKEAFDDSDDNDFIVTVNFVYTLHYTVT